MPDSHFSFAGCANIPFCSACFWVSVGVCWFLCCTTCPSSSSSRSKIFTGFGSLSTPLWYLQCWWIVVVLRHHQQGIGRRSPPYCYSISSVARKMALVINQFVATAVAEKLSALQVAEFFADRKARADFKAFDKIMKRRGGKPPRAGDEMPRWG